VTAVVLILVLNTVLVRTPAHREVSPSAWSRTYGPPQVAGVLSSVAFSPNGKVLAVGASGGLQSGSQVKAMTYLLSGFRGTRTQIRKLSPGGGAEAFSPDGAILAAAGGPHNSATYLRDVDSRDKIAILNDHDGSSVESVSFSPDGKTVATNDKNGSVYLWTLPHGPRTTSVSSPGSVSPPGGPNSDTVAFSPRGTTLAMGGSDGQAYLFNTATHSTRTLAAPDSSGITSLAFSPSGALLAASEKDGATYVWNVRNGRRISLDNPDGSGIESMAFSANGKWLATGDGDGTTYLWNLAAKNYQNNPAKSLPNPRRGAASVAGYGVFSVAFSPNSNTLATTDTNGHIYLWPVP
jgi:WD40 repeat protein